MPTSLAMLAALAGPPDAIPRASSQPGAAAAPSYSEIVAEIAALTAAIDAGEDVRGPLFDALARLPRHAPTLAHDAHARAIRIRAQLDLARVYLGEGQRASAAGIVDEVLRASLGDPVPAAELGPSLAALVRERRAALDAAGTASVTLRCPAEIQAYLDERPLAGGREGLYLGIYRVALVRPEPRGQPSVELRWLRLSQAGERAVVGCDARADVVTTDPPLRPARSVVGSGGRAERGAAHGGGGRVLPPAAQLALVLLGTGLTSSGALLLSLGDRRLSATRATGATLVGLGGVAVVFGGISFAVDEVRAGRTEGRQALLRWQLSF